MDRKSVSVSDRVIHAVARETDTDPLALPPLYDVVDGDSLNAYVEHMDDGALTFTYAGVTVTIFGSGSVQVTPTTAPATETATEGSQVSGD